MNRMRYPAKIRGIFETTRLHTVNTTKHFNNGQEVGVPFPYIYVPLPGLDWSSEWVGMVSPENPAVRDTSLFVFKLRTFVPELQMYS